MALNFRLFNCDRTYSLDKVEDLIKIVCPQASVEQEYFPLPRMSEICEKLDKEEKFSGYMVFVVHAHESRLSLNEKNAGIGYAKLYNTLLKISDNRVLIVIGGDDNYKGDEHEKAVLSEWAWRKIYSQFTEEFLDGTISFIFSWDKEHQPIHEEALKFYLNTDKPRQKFVPKPKPKQTVIVQSREPTARDEPRLKPQEESNNSGSMGNSNEFHLSTEKSEVKETSLKDIFPPKDNKGRPLPDLKKKESSGSTGDQVKTCPSVQVLSVLSRRDDILQSSVLDVLAKAWKSYSRTTPCGPYVPDIQPQNLPRHVEETKPDIVILVSDYDDLRDVENVPYNQQQFRDMFQAVKHLETTKIVAVVTGDKSYKEGDLSSRQVEHRFEEINNCILKHDKIKILSWAKSPSTIHHDVLVNLIGSCKPKPRQAKAPSVPQRGHAEKGWLRYSAVIKEGCILAVLHSDPFYWKPVDGLMTDVLKTHQRRSTIEMWEDNDGRIQTTINRESTLRKLLDVGSTSHHHSMQVYSYHGDESTFEEIQHFLQWIGVEYHPLKQTITMENMLENIAHKSPDFVAFSIDLEDLQDTEVSEGLIRKYGGYVKPIIEKLNGIVVMVTGDKSNRGEQVVSGNVRDLIEGLFKGFEISHKIIMMSWEHRPFEPHQDTMKNLMKRSSASQPTHSSRPLQTSRNSQGQFRQQTKTTLRREVEYDRTKGFLRFRAELIYGRVGKIETRVPPDLFPDQIDLDFLAEKYCKTPKAVLELWGHSYDGPPGPPVVKTDEKRSYFSIFR